jgi:hypothetical protein
MIDLGSRRIWLLCPISIGLFEVCFGLRSPNRMLMCIKAPPFFSS